MATPHFRSAAALLGLILLLSEGLAAAAEGAAEQGPFAATTVVGRVGGDELTLGGLLLRFATLPQAQRDRYLAGGDLEAFLEDTLSSLATARAAVTLGVEDDPLFSRLLSLHREQLLADFYARRTLLAEIDEEVLSARYEAQKELRFRSAPRLHLRYLLVTPKREEPVPNQRDDDAVGAVAAEAEIRRLAARLGAGEPLAELARQYSEDASAAQGGDLGWVEAQALEPVIAKTVAKLAVGEGSGVVESPLGWHLIELIDRRDGGLVPFAVVRELLYQEIVGERWLELATRALEDRRVLLEQQEVDRFPERLP